MTQQPQFLIIVGDGMADWPIPELDGKTPLAYAQTPALDFIASRGQSGFVRTIPPDCLPGSDTANMSILGYDPSHFKLGRGAIEAASLGLVIPESQVAFRCNFVTIENNRMIDFTAGHITTEESETLIRELNHGFQDQGLSFYVGVGYRHIVLADNRYADIQATPPHDITDQDITDHLPKGPNSPDLIRWMMNESPKILQKSVINQTRIKAGKRPVTHIWLWAQGTKPQLPNFTQKYHLQGGIITAVGLLKGLGLLLGLETPDVTGATGFIDTNYANKVAKVQELLKTLDFVFLHVEAPDETGHMGDYQLKIKAIEDFDRYVVNPLLDYQKNHPHLRLLVLPDHPTPCEIKTHTADPVPFALYHPGINPIPSTAYNETAIQTNPHKLSFSSGPALLTYFLAL